ncbi:MAG: protein TolR [Rhodospirillales bacterium]|jgi:biopolymer transport protein TolR|nr:protein TolR [Rhodospirillales bacterium]
MSFTTQRSGLRRLGGREKSRPMADINVTPMVDVMLVLLVIFMVTAPLLTVGVQVDLPKTSADALPGQDEPLAVTVNAEGEIFLQDTQVNLENLAPRLIAITNNNPEARIFVRGDKGVVYGRIMQVMGTVNAAGFSKVALVTERMPASTPAPGKAPEKAKNSEAKPK